MKRTLLFIACVLASVTMYAQEEPNDYLPFVELGKTWNVDDICEIELYGLGSINPHGINKTNAFISAAGVGALPSQ